MVDGLLNKLRGETIKGNDLWLTIKPQAQQVAMSLLAGKCGAAVALDPRTGAVQVMASRPTYNPNLVESNFTKILRTRAPCTPASPLVNRATVSVRAASFSLFGANQRLPYQRRMASRTWFSLTFIGSRLSGRKASLTSS